MAIRKPSAVVVARACTTGYSMGIGGEHASTTTPPAMTRISRRSSLNALQTAMVDRNIHAAREVVLDSHLTRLSRFTPADYDKAAWVYNNRPA